VLLLCTLSAAAAAAAAAGAAAVPAADDFGSQIVQEAVDLNAAHSDDQNLDAKEMESLLHWAIGEAVAWQLLQPTQQQAEQKGDVVPNPTCKSYGTAQWRLGVLQFPSFYLAQTIMTSNSPLGTAANTCCSNFSTNYFLHAAAQAPRCSCKHVSSSYLLHTLQCSVLRLYACLFVCL
jgi:hypothetical protein